MRPTLACSVPKTYQRPGSPVTETSAPLDNLCQLISFGISSSYDKYYRNVDTGLKKIKKEKIERTFITHKKRNTK